MIQITSSNMADPFSEHLNRTGNEATDNITDEINQHKPTQSTQKQCERQALLPCHLTLMGIRDNQINRGCFTRYGKR